MAVDIIARAMAASNSGGGSGEVGDYIPISQKGASNGVATLDGTGKVVQNLAVLPRVITTKQILTYDFSNQTISLTKGLITIDAQVYNGAVTLIFKHNLLLYEGDNQDYTITSNQISLNEPLVDGEMIYVVLIKSGLSYS